jgi:hypothetical protein
MRLCRPSLNFAHVPVVYAGHLPIVPGDCDCIPTRFSDNAAISGIASPINAGALLRPLDSLTVIGPPLPPLMSCKGGWLLGMTALDPKPELGASALSVGECGVTELPDAASEAAP